MHKFYISANSTLKWEQCVVKKEYWKLLNEQNKYVQNSHIDIDIFTTFFSELNSVKISNAVYTPQYLNNEINTSINLPFTFEEVSHAIKKKKSGVDYIINEYLKYSP